MRQYLIQKYSPVNITNTSMIRNSHMEIIRHLNFEQFYLKAKNTKWSNSDNILNPWFQLRSLYPTIFTMMKEPPLEATKLEEFLNKLASNKSTLDQDLSINPIQVLGRYFYKRTMSLV